MTDRTNFVPPAAEGLPHGCLDSATEGADRLDAWALDPHGRNFLAHALVQLARDGWLRAEPGEGFEPVTDRETPEPEDAPAVPTGQAPDTDRGGLRQRIAEAVALRHNGPASDGRGWFRNEAEHQAFLADADAVLAVLPASAEEHRLALSEALGLGTGAPWDAIHDRARELRSADESAQEGWEQAAIQRSRATAWREGAEQAEAEVERLRIDRAAVLREEAARIRAHCPDHLDSDSAEGSWINCHCAVADDMLRRLSAAPAVVSAVPGQTDDETTGEARCTCADAGASFAPADHYADCPQAAEQPAAGAQQPKEA